MKTHPTHICPPCAGPTRRDDDAFRRFLSAVAGNGAPRGTKHWARTIAAAALAFAQGDRIPGSQLEVASPRARPPRFGDDFVAQDFTARALALGVEPTGSLARGHIHNATATCANSYYRNVLRGDAERISPNGSRLALQRATRLLLQGPPEARVITSGPAKIDRLVRLPDVIEALVGVIRENGRLEHLQNAIRDGVPDPLHPKTLVEYTAALIRHATLGDGSSKSPKLGDTAKASFCEAMKNVDVDGEAPGCAAFFGTSLAHALLAKTAPPVTMINDQVPKTLAALLPPRAVVLQPSGAMVAAHGLQDPAEPHVNYIVVQQDGQPIPVPNEAESMVCRGSTRFITDPTGAAPPVAFQGYQAKGLGEAAQASSGTPLVVVLAGEHYYTRDALDTKTLARQRVAGCRELLKGNPNAKFVWCYAGPKGPKEDILFRELFGVGRSKFDPVIHMMSANANELVGYLRALERIRHPLQQQYVDRMPRFADTLGRNDTRAAQTIEALLLVQRSTRLEMVSSHGKCTTVWVRRIGNNQPQDVAEKLGRRTAQAVLRGRIAMVQRCIAPDMSPSPPGKDHGITFRRPIWAVPHPEALAHQEAFADDMSELQRLTPDARAKIAYNGFFYDAKGGVIMGCTESPWSYVQNGPLVGFGDTGLITAALWMYGRFGEEPNTPSLIV